MTSSTDTTTASSSSSTVTPTTLQTTHIHHLISVKLESNNYLLWLTQFKPLLKGYDLEGYVDGTLPCPPRTLSSDATTINLAYLQWQKQDQILLGWLLSSLRESVLAQPVGLSSTRDVWNALEKHYASKSIARIHVLRCELQRLQKGNQSITQYFLEAKTLADSLFAAGNAITDSELQQHILSGLDETYNAIVTTLITTVVESSYESLLGHKIKYFQSDNGGEFKKFTPYLDTQGIYHRFSCPHTSAQNDIAERRHRHVVETGLSLLYHASMPLSYWDNAFTTACYLINRIPSVSSDHTPLQKLFNRTPEAHLFEECSFSKPIWHALLIKLGFNRTGLAWNEEVRWCLDHFQTKGLVVVVQRLTFCAFISHVWAERNRRYHEAKSMLFGQVIDLIITDVKLRAISIEGKVKDDNFNRLFMGRWNLAANFIRPTIKECSWVGPSRDTYMINTDGSLTNATEGIGAIIRDEHGSCIMAAAGSVNPATITVHELQAVEMGLIMARSRLLTRITIATDSTTVVHLLRRGDQSGPWHVIQILRRIEGLRSQFESFFIQHIYRETNRAADHLSKLLPTSTYVEIIESSFAEDFKKILYEDKIGTVYLRL